MVKEVTSFRTSDGQVFESKMDAVTEEAIGTIAKCLSDNRPLAKQILANAEEIAAVLTDYAETQRAQLAGNNARYEEPSVADA